MNLYRQLVWWLLLAVAGALAWHWFSQDLGDVVVRFRGLTYTTTLAYFVLAWGLLWFSLWALWWLLRLPLRAWQRHARQQARNRLVSGLQALHQGRWARAESLLVKAADETDLRTAALIGAHQAASARGDVEAAARHQAALLEHEPQAAALEQASRLASLGRHDDTLAALSGLTGALPPRALLLQARALAATGRAHDAQVQLNTLRREQTLPADALAALERELCAAALTQAPQADSLLQRWNAMPQRLQQTPDVTAAFARRAAQLGLDEPGHQAVAETLDAQWDESLVALYGQLPGGCDGGPRLTRAEGWLAAHAASPALLLALGRLCRGQQLWGKAEDYLHRALAQGAGADAWEALGDVCTAQNDANRAQLAYANALRMGRSETALPLGGRGLREQIADQAVAELRNEHGIPQLPR
ncbi:heme biosynthesis protein HemY [Arenimonas daejeonensis]|uniref:heme biosynthesis protein HemY n=1 Tax=Arenimonas daejeonensis TaxID=370777 RepID=UPI0011BEA9C1|nr:heme biosynthesis HemY N-terminal domain-containing protein [Arenimonas daejeonensis]